MQFPDVRRAPKTVGRRDDETAVSILVRLSIANGMRDMNHLLRSTPRLCAKRVKNRENRIEVASRLSGFFALSIAAATPIRTGARQVALAGETFDRFGTLPGRTCPRCISEDLDTFDAEPLPQRAYRRGWWQVPAISTCPIHRVGLVGACIACGLALDERRLVGTCRCGASDLELRAVAASDCVHDAWLLGRLGFVARIDHPHLDKMPPDVAAEFCRILGSSAKGELPGSGRYADPHSFAQARSLGWRIMLDGDTGLERTLDAIVARNRSGGSVCNTAYGSLHRFLTMNTNAGLDPVRSQILSHARTNIGLKRSGARMFGKAIEGGERLSLTQGNKILRVSPKLLAKVITAITPDFQMNETGPTLLDRDQLLAAGNVVRETMRSTEAGKLLGLDNSLTIRAIERGLLDCLVPPSVDQYGLVWRHSVAKIWSVFTHVPVVASAQLLDPVLFARRSSLTVLDVLASVVEGILKPTGRSGTVADFPALRFQPTDAEGLCTLLREKVPRYRVANALGWQRRTIATLQRQKLLVFEGLMAVGLEPLASFRGEYATAKEAAEWLANPPLDPVALHFMLRNACGPPIISGVAVTAFWPRALLATKLRPLMRADANIHAIGFGTDDWLRNRFSQPRN